MKALVASDMSNLFLNKLSDYILSISLCSVYITWLFESNNQLREPNLADLIYFIYAKYKNK